MFARGSQKSRPGAITLAAILLFACSQEKQSEQQSSTIDSLQVRGAEEGVSGKKESPAEQLVARAEHFAKTLQHDSSFAYYEQASQVYRQAQDWEGYVRTAVELAMKRMSLGKLNVQDSEERLTALLDTTRSRFGEHHELIALIYEKLGRIQISKSALEQALAYFEKEFEILQALPGAPTHQKMDCQIRFAGTYMEKGQYDLALPHLEAALTIWKQAEPELKDWRAGDIFFYFGNLYIFKREFDLAREYYLKALAIWQALPPAEVGPLPLANVHHNLALVNFAKKDYAAAVTLYEKSIALLKQEFGERHWRVASTYMNLGNVYFEMGQVSRAIDYHNQALDMILPSLGETHVMVARGYGNLGSDYAKKADYRKALESYQKALAVFQSVYGKHHPELALCYDLIGDVHTRQRQYDLALVNYQRALAANAPGFSNPDPTKNPTDERVLSETQLLQTLQRKTTALLEKAARSARPAPDLHAANSAGKRALQLVDQLRHGYKAEGAKLFLAENAVEIYNLAIRTAMKLYHITNDPVYKLQIFQYMEKSKAGVLLDALAEAEAKHFAGIADSLLEKEQHLRGDLAYYDRLAGEEEIKGAAADSSKLIAWQSKLFDLQRAYESLLDNFEASYPDYYNLKYRINLASVDEVREKLLDDRTALVEYFVGADSIFIAVVSRNELDFVAVGIDSSFQQKVEQLRESVLAQEYEPFCRTAFSLYQTLIQPIVRKLSASHLIIVPDGPLCFVPFEALLTREVRPDTGRKDYRALPFLLKERTVSYAYSATLLLETLGRSRQSAPRDYLALAPIFSEGEASSIRGSDFIQSNRNVDSTLSLRSAYLPATREEVSQVEELFRQRAGFFRRWFGNNTRVLSGKQADERRLKAEPLDVYRFVHFATHGLINETRPKLSGLLLASEPTSSEDGVLYLGEIYNLKLNADLVVLSACKTALGKMARGEGLLGLTRGFLYAGAASLLVSLWQVNDVSTAELMTAFYDEMLNGASKRDALRAAKLHLMASNPKYARPYFWAPFVLIGK